MPTEPYTAANRNAWNQAAPVHAKQNLERLLQEVQRPDYLDLDDTARSILERIGVQGKAVAQLCCNNGCELLSVANMGAARCVGFDISDAFIDQAGQLAAARQQGLARARSPMAADTCTFERSDVYAIPSAYDGDFDVVMVTVGAVGWLPDLDRFFGVAARLLAPGGSLFIYEMHPLLDLFAETDQADPPQIRYSYFRSEPYVDDTGLDYYGGTNYQSTPSYWFHHKVSDVIGGCLRNGLNITSFEEYMHDICLVFRHFERHTQRLPLSYSLTAQRVR
ncbi:MAG: class I SAM-dependent methyltransferase [Anaerolineae bacterium]